MQRFKTFLFPTTGWKEPTRQQYIINVRIGRCYSRRQRLTTHVLSFALVFVFVTRLFLSWLFLVVVVLNSEALANADHCGVVPGFRLVTSYFLNLEERQVAVGANNPFLVDLQPEERVSYH